MKDLFTLSFTIPHPPKLSELTQSIAEQADAAVNADAADAAEPPKKVKPGGIFIPCK